MSNGNCSRCGEFKKLTRGFCASKCYRFLRRHEIINKLDKIKSPTKLTDDQHEILTGSLLGDGCIFKNKTKNPYFYIARKLTDIEYVKHQFNYFKDFCNSKDVVSYQIFDQRTKNTYHQCKFVTRTSEVFEAYYTDWYKKVKVLPENLVLTPLICAVWFCDDGCITIDKNTNRLRLKLATHNFTKLENERLCYLLKDILKEHFFLCCDNKKYFISSADSGSKKFVEYIEKYIHSSIKRKITWSKDHFSQLRSYSHLKNRSELELTIKEKQVLIMLLKGYGSPKQIAEKMEWKTQFSKTPSGLSLYLNRFRNKNWVIKSTCPVNYSLTEKGLDICKQLHL